MKVVFQSAKPVIVPRNPAVLQANGAIITIDDALIEEVIRLARQAPNGRGRILLHGSSDDSLHEMLIALPRTSCDIPHLNFRSAKSFHVVRGSTTVMIFSDDGTSVRPIPLSAEKVAIPRFVRLNPPQWHTLIPQSDYVVFIETILGPFEGNQFAPWAPSLEDKERWSAFAAALRQIAESAAGPVDE